MTDERKIYTVSDFSTESTEQHYGHIFETRDDINTGTHSKDFTDKQGIVVCHNHYIDGPNHYARNHEVTLYNKDVKTQKYNKLRDSELNTDYLLYSLKYFEPKDQNSSFDFDKFAHALLLGNFESEYVKPFVKVNKLVNEPCAKDTENYRYIILNETYKRYKDMHYDGMLPSDWFGLLRQPSAIYYITINNIDPKYL